MLKMGFTQKKQQKKPHRHEKCSVFEEPHNCYNSFFFRYIHSTIKSPENLFFLLFFYKFSS